MDRQALVQQYVERQRAYVPTYAAERSWNEHHGMPSKVLRNDEFGFDTPVLRPRVAKNRAARSQRTQRAEPGLAPGRGLSPTPPREAPSDSDNQGNNLDRPRSKQKKTSVSIDSDNERAARLADRRERKRKKRAIVNPSQERNDNVVPAAVPKKGKASGKKLKTPATLALLYGFSATNVTKGRLTLKPAPSLGVFNKGKASAKKKVTAAGKSSSGNDVFSESVFLNKPSERAADHSQIDDGSDGSSVSSISARPVTQDIRTMHRTKNRGKCPQTPPARTKKASVRTTAASEVWDIEVQSQLPSSARDVSSDLDAEDSVPAVLDLRRADWATSINVTERGEHRTVAGTPSLSASRGRLRADSVIRGSLLAMSEEPHAVGASSVHPSHSASQVGTRAADPQRSDLCVATSKYFTEPEPASNQGFATDPPRTPRPNDGIDVPGAQIPGQDVENAALNVQTAHGAASPMNSLLSAPQWTAQFRTRYDMVPPEFPSDGSPYDDYYAHTEAAYESLAGTPRGCFESCFTEAHGNGAAECRRGTEWDWCRSLCSSAGLVMDDVDVPMAESEGIHDPLAREYERDLGESDGPCIFETQAEYDHEGCQGSTCFSDEDGDGEVADFLEGQALLLGMEDGEEGRVGFTGLVQAEMEVAGRLRNHWRPVRY